MSFKTNEYQQITLNDSFINLSPRTQKIIMNSWCKDFADIVFPAINEERFAVLYSSNNASRSNTPINFIIGSLMLKENNGLTDDELVESICCDVRYQYALHTTHLAEQPVSDRTFSRFRERLYNYEMETGTNLLEEEMLHLADVYARYMNLHSNVKRMDSLMIASRCKRMSRLEIIYQTTANAVCLIHRLGHDELINSGLRHYLDADDHNQMIYYCKTEDVSPRLEKVLREAQAVKDLMSDELWYSFSEYQLLLRVLREQGTVDEEGNLAESKNTELVTTALTGKTVDKFYAGFQFSEDGTKMLNCPMGHAPLKTTYYPKTGMCRALFAKDCCENCPHKNDCKCKPQKKNYAVHASASMASRARHLEKLSTKKYIELIRLRNAIEGIPSVLRRKYRIDEIPVFGKLRSRQFVLFKIGAYNFGKLFRHNHRLGVESAQNLIIA